MQRLSLKQPVIQAPMAGGGDTPALVAAVSEAGGLGVIGAAYLSPQQILDAAAAVRAATRRPFGINLFAPLPAPDMPDDAAAAIRAVAPFYAELGLPEPALPTVANHSFAEQVEAVLASGAALFSVTFGLPHADVVAATKAKGMFFAATATTVAEAVAVEQAGADMVVVQGGEAGGHRGTFAVPFEKAMVGTMALVPQAVDAVSIPVVASGGIMDGRGIAAALALGASAVQMGTAFLTTTEAGIPEAYKDRILAAHDDETRVTRAFSGRPARGIANRFMETIDAGGHILPFPLQNSLTRPMRTAAAKAGQTDYLSLWAGQGVRLARRQGAAELMARLAAETAEAVARLSRHRP